MKNLLALLSVLTTVISYAQENNVTSGQLYFGRSLHGAGDASGIEYGGIYISDLGRKGFWFAELAGSIHDDDWPLFYTTPSGETVDASIHYTTAGVQSVAGVGFKVLQKSKHEIALRIGAIARYQSTSYPDFVGVYYPPFNGLDFPVVTFENTTPTKTMSLGGRGSFSYSFSFTSKFFLAVNASLQTDSNGDTLTSTTVGFGRKL